MLLIKWFAVWKVIIVLYVVMFLLVSKRKFRWSILGFDFLILVICGLFLAVGTNFKNYVYMIKYVLLALPIFCFVRYLSSYFNSKIKFIFISLIQIIYLLLPLANLSYYLETKHGLGKDAMFALAQTNWSEGLSFLKARPLLTGSFITFVIILFSLFYVVNRHLDNNKTYYSLTSRWGYVLIALLLLFGGNYCLRGVLARGNLSEAYRESRSFLMGIVNKHVPADLQAVELDKKMGNMVVVIGESANRDYFSLYGFKHDTTPWLSSMKADANFLWFPHAYTCNKFTGKAVPMALSEFNQYNGLKMGQGTDLVEIFHALGYKIWWISNQGRNKNFEEGFMNIAMRADYRIFLDNDKPLYDEMLITHLTSIKFEKNLVFVHQIGSHGNYVDRSPQEFKKFYFPGVSGNANDFNEYCDSLLYTDYVLRSIFKKAAEQLRPDLFLYFSDHGEKPGVPRDHFEFPMSHIPLVMWFSDSYLQRNPDIFANLKKHQNSYFTNDMLYDTLLGIARVKSNHYSSRFDLSSLDYDYNKDTVMTEYGTIKISDDPQIKE